MLENLEIFIHISLKTKGKWVTVCEMRGKWRGKWGEKWGENFYIPPGEIVKGYAWEIIEIHPKSLRGCSGEMAKTPFTLLRGMSEEIINCPCPYLRNY